MTPPVRSRARLTDKRVYNDKFIHYFFEYVEPPRVPFQAGQYISLQVSDRGDRRSYSLCNSPSTDHGFELLVDITPQGLGTQYLETLAIGQEANVLGPLGVFTITETSPTVPIIFAATGSGIAPFRSMIMDLLQNHHDQRPITLYWGLRYESQLFWQDEFQQLSEAFPNFSFHPVISQAGDEWPLCRGRVTNCLSVHDVDFLADFYLCGNEAMVTDVLTLLTAKGVTPERIHREKFF